MYSMKLIAVVFVLMAFIHNPTYAQIEQDDILHFSAGMLAGAGGALISSEISDGNRFWTFAGAVAASALAGTIKEAIDEKKYNGWSNRDLGATVLGGISAGITIDLFTAKRKKRKQQAYITAWNSK